LSESPSLINQNMYVQAKYIVLEMTLVQPNHNYLYGVQVWLGFDDI